MLISGVVTPRNIENPEVGQLVGWCLGSVHGDEGNNVLGKTAHFDIAQKESRQLKLLYNNDDGGDVDKPPYVTLRVEAHLVQHMNYSTVLQWVLLRLRAACPTKRTKHKTVVLRRVQAKRADITQQRGSAVRCRGMGISSHLTAAENELAQAKVHLQYMTAVVTRARSAA